MLVLHEVLHGAFGDDVELQGGVPVPVDTRPVKLVHNVQVETDGVVLRPLEVQGHEGVVGEDLCDLHRGPPL